MLYFPDACGGWANRTDEFEPLRECLQGRAKVIAGLRGPVEGVLKHIIYVVIIYIFDELRWRA
jgi:hypothetical protein